MPPNNPNPPVNNPYVTQLPKKRPIVLIIALVLVTLLLFGAVGFGYWAFAKMKIYKNDTDKLVNAAVESNTKQVTDQKDKEFEERYKNPLKDYVSPDAYGGIGVKYPKTWSAYVNESGVGATPVDGYFHPSFVPGLRSGTAFAFHLEVTNKTYAEEMKVFDSQVRAGRLHVSPYQPVKVKGVLGSVIKGEIIRGQQDTMILLPLRDKTIKLSTQSDKYLNDFNKIILANLTFTP